jgi:hypothetical protein
MEAKVRTLEIWEMIQIVVAVNVQSVTDIPYLDSDIAFIFI